MTIDENNIRREMIKSDERFLDELTGLLRSYDYNLVSSLAHFVAALCNVDVADMLSSIDKSHLSQARWLFWYAYRYITGYSFMHIADVTIYDGHKFAWRSIAGGITNMATLVVQDNIWKKRWAITKRFIVARSDADQVICEKIMTNDPIKITVTVPKKTKVEIKEL